MRGVKVAGLIILGLLLFISLTVFGLAFTLNRTILNPGFVTSEVNRLEIASLVDESLPQQSSDTLSARFTEALSSALHGLEPRLHEEADAAIYSVYDYLLGGRENPELASVLRSTFLGADFIGAVLDELDISSLVTALFVEELADELPLPEEVVPHVSSAFEEAVAHQEPWIKEQLGDAALPIADYLVGERESFSVAIPVGPLMERLKRPMWEALRESLPPQLQGLPPDLLEQGFEQFYAEFEQGLPDTMEIDETVIGKEARSQVAALVAEGEAGLVRARGYVDYFQTVYILLILFIVVLVAAIVLIHRGVKGSTRTLGIVFLAAGLVVLVGGLIGRDVVGTQIMQAAHDAPAQLQVWMPQLVADVLAPLQFLGIGFIVAGIGLIVVSIVYGSRY